MKTVPTANKRGNPDVKWAIIPFLRPELRNLERGQFHTYKLCTTPVDATLPDTLKERIKFRRGLAVVLKGQNVTLGPASYALVKTLLKGDALTMFEQAEITPGNQTVPHFNECLNDVAEHGFDPVDQGLHKFVEFCTRLESCESSKDKPKVEKLEKTGEER
eukprot:13615233-Ditylum_brightwellii.AAC.1